MELKMKHCKPCEGSAAPLTHKEENEFMHKISDWSIERSPIHKLIKNIKLNSFIEAIEYVNKVSIIAEEEQHHPDIAIHYNCVQLQLWTHAINGLSENDFILASKINEIRLHSEKKNVLDKLKPV